MGSRKHPDRAKVPAEQLLLQALRGRDEKAFRALADRFHAPMLRVAKIYVRNDATAEEVVQETWVGVLRGLKGFRGHSSLKTWIFSILVNQAKGRALKERRYVAARTPDRERSAAWEPSVDPSRFLQPDHPQWPGHWSIQPRSWGRDPESLLLTKEARKCIEREVEILPHLQRAVVTLRDFEQWDHEEVCDLLEISEAYQRVLLHRARSKVRKACEEYLDKK